MEANIGPLQPLVLHIYQKWCGSLVNVLAGDSPATI